MPWALQFLPHLFTSSPAEFHYEIANLAEQRQRLVIAAPRSHAKSTLLALAYPLYRAACFREPFILIVSDTAPQAEQRTSDIFAELLDNDTLLEAYPHLALPQKKDYLKQRVKRTTREFMTMGGIRFTGAGAGQSLRGIRDREHRPTLIVVDDLENDEAVLTEYQREKLDAWFNKALLNLPGPRGSRLIMIGTILHQESLLNRLLSPERSDVWEQRVYRAIDGAGQALWPSEWPLEALDRKRAEIGSRAFSSEFMNEPVDDESVMFRSGWIDVNRRLAAPSSLSRLAVAVDPSATAAGDACGIVVGGISEDNHGYVLEDVTTAGSPRTWARVILEAFWRWEADEIVAERNNGGDMIIATLASVLEDGEKLPPIKLVWASRGKVTRADPIAAMVESGRIHMVGHHPRLEKELTTWRPGMPSPNRLDAFVWLFSWLLIDGSAVDLMLGWVG